MKYFKSYVAECPKCGKDYSVTPDSDSEDKAINMPYTPYELALCPACWLNRQINPTEYIMKERRNRNRIV